MSPETAIKLADRLLYGHTGRHLSDLQHRILYESWQGKPYRVIAELEGYTEGHIKDVAADLWRYLSDALGERITKGNFRSRLRHASFNYADTTSGLTEQPTPESPYFLGRTAACATLDTLAKQHRLIVIQGEGGRGKTTLAKYYLRQTGCDHILELLMAKDSSHITPVEQVIEEWLRRDFQEEPGVDFGVALSRLQRHLRTSRVGILIDNLEPALDVNGQLIPPHRAYRELLRILSVNTLKSLTLITSRDRLCEPSVKAYHYRLPELDFVAWQAFFQAQEITVAPEDALRSLHRIYGGNAKAMEIICGTIQTEFDGDLLAYWQLNQAHPLPEIDLTNLIAHQLDRLESLDPTAYEILGRLSCYRFQGISQLPLAALNAQMSDIPFNQQRQIIASLRNRSLLESCQGLFWLHPAVRAAILSRWHQTSQWKNAHRNAAQFWTDSVAEIKEPSSALQAFEAYYHVLEISDFKAAAEILLYSRLNQWQQFLPLASSLYRLGLLQPVVDAITTLLPQLTPSEHTSELNNLLGDAYWIRGQVQDAITCQEQTLTIAQKRLSETSLSPKAKQLYYLKMLKIDAQLSLGLYHIDLWELTIAEAHLTNVIALATNTPHQPWATKAKIALALVNAHQGHFAIAKQLADEVSPRLLNQTNSPGSGRLAYFIELLAQTYIQTNQLELAQQLTETAITYAEASHYPQIKAKALTGLSIIARKRTQFSVAFKFHTDAIQTLAELGARCDLAEAHLQFALSLQAAQMRSQSIQITANISMESQIQQAKDLYLTLNAPTQAQRIQHLFQETMQAKNSLT